ncbi:MAG: gluconeogenesis factor YvcK family protein [Christensenellales bacterium]|jgi:uncharacterized cofD-like protein
MAKPQRRGGWNLPVSLLFWVLCFVAGLLFVWVTNRFAYYRSRQVLFVVGILMMIFSAVISVFTLIRHRSMQHLLDKTRRQRGPKVVAIGGGTGLSALLRGLKGFTENITAVVTVADDGGSSGRLRKEMGVIPPGDIRNCIMALADAEPVMDKLMQYRFKDGDLSGQSLGNLLIAALSDMNDGGFMEAVTNLSEVLAVTGRVLPVSLSNIVLHAQLRDGTVVSGESAIPKMKLEKDSQIYRTFITPEDAKPLPEVLQAIAEADLIVMGPGSLYTSIIPNLLVKGVAEAIGASKALRVYVGNIMTQPGETDGYTLADHVHAITKHGQGRMVDVIVANRDMDGVPEAVLSRYREDGAEPVQIDRERLERKGITILEVPLVRLTAGAVRHNPEALQEVIERIYRQRADRDWRYLGLWEELNGL